MSQEEDGAEAQASSTPDTAGLAIDLAMEEARNNPSLQGDAAAFLRNQDSLIDIQKHHLREQFKHLRLGIWEKRMGVLLRAGTVLMGLAVMLGIAGTIWHVVHANGLIIEEFTVPGDMAARGLTGQAVATHMLDKLSDMQNLTQSSRAPRSYVNNWGSDIKVQIPDTGISIGEAYRFLRDFLGHDSHVSGELYRTAAGIAITARIRGQAAVTFAGAEADLNALEQKAAEQIYASAQPYRYGVYLMRRARFNESEAVFRALAKTGPPSERAWGYSGMVILARLAQEGADPKIQLSMIRRSMELDPTNVVVMSNLAFLEARLGQTEQALNHYRDAPRLVSAEGHGQYREDYIPAFRLNVQGQTGRLSADFTAAAAALAELLKIEIQQSFLGTEAALASVHVQAHDLAAARAILDDPLPAVPGFANMNPRLKGIVRIEIAVMTQDWAQALRQNALQPLLSHSQRRFDHLEIDPMVAVAQAKLGRIAEAEALVSDMPGDCDPCLRARARIAATKGEPARADWWFARAAQAAPSIPFADADWGQVLLERGQPDAAIEKFKLANQKGPRFADPLEGWGEALMAKNQSHLALAKFKEADKYAPNWGRLHLKWGEALAYAGKKDEAKAHFARAAQLDLTTTEKAALTKWAANHI